MVEHVDIVDGERHEAKGASIASNNQVLHANGDGTTTFKFIDYNNIQNTPTLQGYQPVLVASSTASVQQPAATNTAIKVEFGPAQSNPFVTLDNLGNLTFLTAGYYAVYVGLRFGRSTAAGAAVLFGRVLSNGVQVGNSFGATLIDDAERIPVNFTHFANADANDIMAVEFYRDSSGINNGGLYATSPALAGWNQISSSSLYIYRFVGD